MDIAFPQDQVVVALDLDFVAVLGVEQHLVPWRDRPHVRPGSDYLGPRQAAGDLGRSGNEDAGARLPLALAARDLHEHSIREHLNSLLRSAVHAPNLLRARWCR